ncbi:hypothetical protein T4B_13667 [Trichinella pseudospiralis]|uniref:Uncharacterized protein n=1 Tax=Trichinella pseudospiralis TaxID=6337 RepID=A0A0V1IMS8_TRIPS|nr:hypothetical protein T4B_13667 [Trichinella pseudospiralis]
MNEAKIQRGGRVQESEGLTEHIEGKVACFDQFTSIIIVFSFDGGVFCHFISANMKMIIFTLDRFACKRSVYYDLRQMLFPQLRCTRKESCAQYKHLYNLVKMKKALQRLNLKKGRHFSSKICWENFVKKKRQSSKVDMNETACFRNWQFISETLQSMPGLGLPADSCFDSDAFQFCAVSRLSATPFRSAIIFSRRFHFTLLPLLLNTPRPSVVM